MKRKWFLVAFLVAFLGMTSRVQAASISVTAPNTVTSGGKVTFNINIKGAAAWQLKGTGTGATSGCSLGDQGVGDSGNGKNINKTLSVTCNATSVGQISFSVSGNITDANTNRAVDVSGRKIVVVQAPREKDTNNFLKSFSVKGYELKPGFQKDVLEYTVDVPSTVDKVVLEASAESGYASVSGTGEVEVNEGSNPFSIVVTSETGSERTYKVTVNVKDENPIKVSIGDREYTIIKNIKNIVKPEVYEVSTIKIQDMEVPSFVSEVTGFTLVAIKDEEGKNWFAIYDESANSYSLYQEQKSTGMIIYIMDPVEELEGYLKTTVEIFGVSYPAFQVKENSDFAVIYGMNVETGDKKFYLYHRKDNVFQEYFDEMVVQLREDQKVDRYIIFGSVLGCVIFFLLTIMGFMRKPNKKLLKKLQYYEAKYHSNFDETNRLDETKTILKDVKDVSKKKKKNQRKKSQKNLESEQKVETLEVESDASLDVTEALQKMNNAEDIIREYEQTVALSKEELKTQSSSDDEMYDMFSEDKKKKKRK